MGRRYPTTNQRNTKMIVIMTIMIIVIIIIMGLPNTPSRSKHAGGNHPTHTTPQGGKGGNHQSPHPNHTTPQGGGKQPTTTPHHTTGGGREATHHHTTPQAGGGGGGEEPLGGGGGGRRPNRDHDLGPKRPHLQWCWGPTERGHIYYHYGLGPQETILTMVLGAYGEGPYILPLRT